jgi:transposase-like protein
MKTIRNQYLKRTQKDYSQSFKLAVVKEVESGKIGNRAAMLKYGIQGHGTITSWRRKFGILDIENSCQIKSMQSPEQKIKELEQRVRLLERQNEYLEDQLMRAEDKAAILDKVIELAEEEYLLPIRKNSLPDQSGTSAKKAKRP